MGHTWFLVCTGASAVSANLNEALDIGRFTFSGLCRYDPHHKVVHGSMCSCYCELKLLCPGSVLPCCVLEVYCPTHKFADLCPGWLSQHVSCRTQSRMAD